MAFVNRKMKNSPVLYGSLFLLQNNAGKKLNHILGLIARIVRSDYKTTLSFIINEVTESVFTGHLNLVVFNLVLCFLGFSNVEFIGIKAFEHLINKIANLYQHKLDLIGLWHRHPGSFDQFSSTDDDTNARYAAMRKEGAISGLVNIDPRFRFTMYHVMSPCKYQTIPYEAGDDLIPPELLAYRTPDRFYDLMEKRMRSGGRNAERPAWRRSVSFESFLHFVQPYLSEYECNEVSAGFSVVDPSTPDQLIDEVLDDLTFMTE